MQASAAAAEAGAATQRELKAGPAVLFALEFLKSQPFCVSVDVVVRNWRKAARNQAVKALWELSSSRDVRQTLVGKVVWPNGRSGPTQLEALCDAWPHNVLYLDASDAAAWLAKGETLVKKVGRPLLNLVVIRFSCNDIYQPKMKAVL